MFKFISKFESDGKDFFIVRFLSLQNGNTEKYGETTTETSGSNNDFIRRNNMDYSVIDYYMETHDFILCDRQKIKKFIETENRMRKGKHKFIGGYLTRSKLCLCTGYGVSEEYDRIFLGVQDNIK